MKRIYLRLICSVLCVIMCISSVMLTNATAADQNSGTPGFTEDVPFIMYEYEQGYRVLGPTGDLSAEADTTEQTAPANASQSKSDIAPTGTDTNLPYTVDNSATKYFPPIGNQATINSCVVWSTAYYQFTYEVNRMCDTAATENYIASPKFIYNVINHGNNGGTEYASAYRMLQSFGAPSIDMVPFDNNYLDWSATDNIWREAMRYRLDDFYVFSDIGTQDTQITSADDPDLLPIKTALAQGKVLSYSTYISSWVSDKLKTNPDAPENDKFKDEMIAVYQDGTIGGHRMTIVGYNDNIWCDINKNDKVDAGEMGAFKVANTYTENYANKGFIWVAYDALNMVSSVEGASFTNKVSMFSDISSITVRPYNDGADLYLKYTLNTSDRTQKKVTVLAERNGTVISHQMFWGVGFISDVNKYAFDGTTTACDGTIALALDVIVPGITSASLDEYSWSIIAEDTSKDDVPVKLLRAEITDESRGVSYKVNYDEPVVLDGSAHRIDFTESNLCNTVIYYIGYDNPTLHYKIGEGQWTSVAMEENMENRGYMYKYIIEGTIDETKVYFTDEKGNKDDNNSLYYTADKRLNCYYTTTARAPLSIDSFSFSNGLPDVTKRMHFDVKISGGYEPYRYQYKIENLTTGATYEYDSDKYPNHSHQFTSEGKYRITTLISDYSNTTVSHIEEVDVEDVPFVFSEFYENDEKHFTGNNINFYAKTEFEGVFSYAGKRNTYDFVIKDQDGKIVFTKNKFSDAYDMGSKTSEITLDWTAPKSGKYTITISSTALKNEYAEKSMEFTVYDKLYGDADGNSTLNIKDATLIQKHSADVEITTAFYEEMADCDKNENINVKDATLIQKYLADFENTGDTGNPIPYTPPVEPTEPTEPSTPPETQPETTTPAPEINSVTFTNSFRWSGQIYCYYWAENETFVGWPGTPMSKSYTNEYGEDVYYLQIPSYAKYVIFSNGSTQTTDIPFPGGEVRYYPITDTDSNGRNKVNTW